MAQDITSALWMACHGGQRASAERLLNDLFADVGATPAVSCRLYRNSTGVAGLPALRRLREVLKQAVDSGATAD